MRALSWIRLACSWRGLGNRSLVDTKALLAVHNTLSVGERGGVGKRERCMHQRLCETLIEKGIRQSGQSLLIRVMRAVCTCKGCVCVYVYMRELLFVSE